MFRFALLAVFVLFGQSYSFNLPEELYYDDQAPEIQLSQYAQPLTRVRRQFFGGVTPLSGNSYNQQFGYRAPVFTSPSNSFGLSGSLSQTKFTPPLPVPMPSTPITYGLGADWSNRGGHAAGISTNFVPGLGGSGSALGQLGLINTPSHKANAWVKQDRSFDANWNTLGKTNTQGLTYSHGSGLGASVSQSQTPGLPNAKTIGAKIPIVNTKDAQIGVEASRTFREGFPNNDQIGISANVNF